MWVSITDEQAKEKFGKSAGELKGVNEVYGPKLILSEYYDKVFQMEDRAITRLNDLYYKWIKPYVTNDIYYPVDAVFTSDELDVIDRYRSDFERAVSEQEGLWIKDGGPNDSQWQSYIDMLNKSCGMDKLLELYQNAYTRYVEASGK